MNMELKRQIDEIMENYDYSDIVDCVVDKEVKMLRELTSEYGGAIDVREFRIPVIYFKDDAARRGKALTLSRDKILVDSDDGYTELIDRNDWMPLEVKYLIDGIKDKYPLKRKDNEDRKDADRQKAI